MTLKDVSKKLRPTQATKVHVARKGRTFCGRDVTPKLTCQSEDLPVPGNICSVCLENLSAIRVVRMA